ncbi:MAG: DMT family transporter [Rickettsiales bacterium]
MANTTSAYRSSIPGIIFMLINTVCLTGLDAMSKILTADLPSNIVVFLYKFSLFVIILPWVFTKGMLVFKTKRLRYHFLRAVLSVLASICFFSGLKQVSMVDAAALENLQYLIITILGFVLFNEKFTASKLLAICTGMLGAFVVINPSLMNFNSSSFEHHSLNIGHLYIFMAMLFWALNTLTVKKLGITESNRTQMFYLLLFSSIVSASTTLFQWTGVGMLPTFTDFSKFTVEAKHAKFILVMATLYFIHGLAYFNALKYELSVVVPFRYTKFIFSALCSYLIFAEVQQDPRVYMGYALILLASFTMLGDEIKKRRARRLHTTAKPIPQAA